MFTIYHRNGTVLLRTDNEAICRINVLRGNRVTREVFGENVDVDFGLVVA